MTALWAIWNIDCMVSMVMVSMVDTRLTWKLLHSQLNPICPWVQFLQQKDMFQFRTNFLSEYVKTFNTFNTKSRRNKKFNVAGWLVSWWW